MEKGQNVLRLPAEQLYQEEIDALIQAETDAVPQGWKMSPRSVLTYITGGKAGNTTISPKYIGHQRLVEIAIATLVTDRALLLIGEPGTAKSWLSEHLTAAINGDSSKVIQGTAGTTEEQIRYSWNYAMLIAEGPSNQALIKSPLYRNRDDCPGGGDFPLRVRGSGRHDFDFIREADFRAGAGRGGARTEGLLRNCHGKYPG